MNSEFCSLWFPSRLHKVHINGSPDGSRHHGNCQQEVVIHSSSEFKDISAAVTEEKKWHERNLAVGKYATFRRCLLNR